MFRQQVDVIGRRMRRHLRKFEHRQRREVQQLEIVRENKADPMHSSSMRLKFQ
jgi:hypothetical protein